MTPLREPPCRASVDIPQKLEQGGGRGGESANMSLLPDVD